MTALPQHARKLLIFLATCGGEVHIGPFSIKELSTDYSLDRNDIDAAADFLTIVGKIRRDGTRLWEVSR